MQRKLRLPPGAWPVRTYKVRSGEWTNDDGEPCEAGWYADTCFPGCLPEGEPYGPYPTELEAWNSYVEPLWDDVEGELQYEDDDG